MTLNQRLSAAGIMDTFDNALAKCDRRVVAELLMRVDVDPSIATTLLNEESSCWFCGKGITSENDDALSIGLTNIWHNQHDTPTQEIYAHFTCARSRMAGVHVSLEREIFMSEDVQR